MAKTIKFNLICNDYPVRTIEDLKNNFSIEDILEYYHNGLLKKWLQVRGYDEYFTKVSEIHSSSNIDIITELIKIFELESDDSKIRESISILEYIHERKELLQEYKSENYKINNIINEYHKGYDEIINDIINNKDDMARIKANIKKIELNYMEIYKFDFHQLYYLLQKEAPMAIFAILMNDNMRDYYIDEENTGKNRYLTSGNLSKVINEKIISLVSNKTDLKEKLGDELKTFKGDTEAYWKDIEPKDKHFMIIDMRDGNYIRNSGCFGEEISSSDVNGKFLILDGIDYKSNNKYQELLYMEV